MDCLFPDSCFPGKSWCVSDPGGIHPLTSWDSLCVRQATASGALRRAQGALRAAPTWAGRKPRFRAAWVRERTARTGSTARAVAILKMIATEGVGLEPRRPAPSSGSTASCTHMGRPKAPLSGCVGSRTNGPDGVNSSGRRYPEDDCNGGGGTRTHIGLRPPVFKTGSLAIRTPLPPG